ncbi:hypothetical protein LXL04_024167 [Taraxacum kok-saghyz]
METGRLDEDGVVLCTSGGQQKTYNFERGMMKFGKYSIMVFILKRMNWYNPFDCDCSYNLIANARQLGSISPKPLFQEPENSPNFLYLPNRYSFQKTDFGTLQNFLNFFFVFSEFFFATGLVFERFLAPRIRFSEKVNGLGVLSWFKREQYTKTRMREQTWYLDYFRWRFLIIVFLTKKHNWTTTCTHRTTIRPPSDHRRTTVGPPPDHRRTTAGPFSDVDEKTLTLMKETLMRRHADADKGDTDADKGDADADDCLITCDYLVITLLDLVTSGEFLLQIRWLRAVVLQI